MRVSFASFLAVACLASASSTPPAKDGNLAARRLPVVTEDTLARPATSGCAFNEYLTCELHHCTTSTSHMAKNGVWPLRKRSQPDMALFSCKDLVLSLMTVSHR